MTLQRLSAYPHVPTPPGSIVELANPECAGQEFTVLSSFVTEAHTLRPKTAYLLSDSGGNLVFALNGWRTVDNWLSDRLQALRGYMDELSACRDAMRKAAGEQ